ncbi:hypothetical protein V8G54_033627 [Vigna mungo]|uniref:Uncharacterized protein n=1 Tax=Vigna mungo TaxID=3915 RepID=A0AAQ3MN89_VIGMU
MKKLFFFKSSASSSGNNNNATPPKSTNKQKAWDSVSEIGMNNQAYGKADDYFQSSKGLFSKTRNNVSDDQSSSGVPDLRRSRLLSMRNKSGTRQPKFLLSKIRTDMRDLGLPVLQDPITSHLGTHPLVPATFQVRSLIVTLMESSIRRKVGPGTIHKEIIVDMGAMV